MILFFSVQSIFSEFLRKIDNSIRFSDRHTKGSIIINIWPLSVGL